jgi:hypothetical protein
MEPMTDRTRVVEKYINGYVVGDHAQILSCLTDDIVWEIRGYKNLTGKEAFAAEITAQGDALPSMAIHRLIEDDGTVVATGGGSVVVQDGAKRDFVFCEVFTFAGDLVRHLDTYHIWLT